MISVIVPTYNEGDAIIDWLRTLYAEHIIVECLVVDASEATIFERTKEKIEQHVQMKGLHYIAARNKGRAAQMNQATMMCRGNCLIFLHADTTLPKESMTLINQAMENGWHWGRFDVKFDSSRWPFVMIAAMMNWRSRITGLATGDQAIFVSRKAYDLVGGFDDIALMEDIAISKKLKKIGPPMCLTSRVQTSSRRWQKNGIVYTIMQMWWLRLAYSLGMSTGRLAKWYQVNLH